MSEEKLPDEVVHFIAEYIDSAVQVEILLLLRSNDQRPSTAGEIDAVLRINREWVESQLLELSRRGLLSAVAGTQTYCYAPANEKLAAAVAALGHWYSTHRVAIVALIYSRPTDKLRTFADAFRIRRD